MQYLTFIFRNLARATRRSLLTLLSLALSLFLVTSLAAILNSLESTLKDMGDRPILVVTHKSGWFYPLPMAHTPKLRAVPGAVRVVPFEFYGGVFGDVKGAQDNFISMAMDGVEETRAMWKADFVVEDGAWNAFTRDRQAAIVGPKLAQKYGWKVGDEIMLRGTFNPVDLRFKIVGLGYWRTDQTMFLLRREYLQAARNNGEVSGYFVETPSVADMPTVSAAVDRTFADSTDPTRTFTQKANMESFLSQLGDVRGLVTGVAVLVALAILLVSANTMAMAVRERTGEIAVLKALGFGRRHVLGLVLGEALALGVLGGGIGCGAAYVLFHGVGFTLGPSVLSGILVTRQSALTGLGTAAAIGVLSGALPAIHALRLRVVDALRKVG